MITTIRMLIIKYKGLLLRLLRTVTVTKTEKITATTIKAVVRIILPPIKIKKKL